MKEKRFISSQSPLLRKGSTPKGGGVRNSVLQSQNYQTKKSKQFLNVGRKIALIIVLRAVRWSLSEAEVYATSINSVHILTTLCSVERCLYLTAQNSGIIIRFYQHFAPNGADFLAKIGKISFSTRHSH